MKRMKIKMEMHEQTMQYGDEDEDGEWYEDEDYTYEDEDEV